jgi:hypothetical protein
VKRTQERASLQERVAALAARRMVEDGEEADRAKHKSAAALLGSAARALGALPDDEQLGAALRQYLRSAGGPEHRAWLHGQRSLALEWMLRLGPFEPHLVGSVLDGSATMGAPLELHLYADSAKDVEVALLDLGIAFRADQIDDRRRHLLQRIGFVDESAARAAPAGPGRLRGTPILLTVHDRAALRIAPGSWRAPVDPELHPVERCRRADAAMLRRLIDETQLEPPDPASESTGG